MKKILFINSNSDMPRCAIFEAGRRYGAAMKLCKEFELEYAEVPADVDKLTTPLDQYDAVIFNYQHVASSIISPVVFNQARVAIGFLYEARLKPEESPMHFGDLMAGQLFDIILSPDPTLETTRRVWSVPRVVPRATHLANIGNCVFLVSTFGFPSPWKQLGAVVDMLNDEYDEAVFRINFAPASWQEDTNLRAVAEGQIDEAQQRCKPGIRIEATNHYMTEESLINWLHESDVNVFLASPERGAQTGGALLASADLAISAQRPLLISDTVEARHFPSSLRGGFLCESALYSGIVEHLYKLWSPKNFADAMDKLVRENL